MTANEFSKRKEKYLIVGGEKIHYDTLHSKLRRKYGNAIECDFCHTKTAKRYEWALIKGKEYSMEITDYIPLCPSCHRKYDITEDIRKNMSDARKGKSKGGDNPAAKKVINILSNEIYPTVSDAAKSVNLKRTTLVMMLNGSNSNKTNLKYYE